MEADDDPHRVHGRSHRRGALNWCRTFRDRREARSLRRDYWPAYYQWAEYLSRSGRKAEARKLAEEGLSYAPGSKSLRLLVTALGGDPATVPRKAVPEGPAATGAPNPPPASIGNAR